MSLIYGLPWQFTTNTKWRRLSLTFYHRSITVAPHPHGNPVRCDPVPAVLPWMWSPLPHCRNIPTIPIAVQTSSVHCKATMILSLIVQCPTQSHVIKTTVNQLKRTRAKNCSSENSIHTMTVTYHTHTHTHTIQYSWVTPGKIILFIELLWQHFAALQARCPSHNQTNNIKGLTDACNNKHQRINKLKRLIIY